MAKEDESAKEKVVEKEAKPSSKENNTQELAVTKPVYVTADDVDEKIKGLKTLNIVLLIVLAVMFLWVGWISARVQLYSHGNGYYDSSDMMRDMYPHGNNSWNYR